MVSLIYSLKLSSLTATQFSFFWGGFKVEAEGEGAALRFDGLRCRLRVSNLGCKALNP